MGGGKQEKVYKEALIRMLVHFYWIIIFIQSILTYMGKFYKKILVFDPSVNEPLIPTKHIVV